MSFDRRKEEERTKHRERMHEKREEEKRREKDCEESRHDFRHWQKENRKANDDQALDCITEMDALKSKMETTKKMHERALCILRDAQEDVEYFEALLIRLEIAQQRLETPSK
jgi:hypothetical protein